MERNAQIRRDCTDCYQQQCLRWMIYDDVNNPFFDSTITSKQISESTV